jgi:hypothetical protein
MGRPALHKLVVPPGSGPAAYGITKRLSTILPGSYPVDQANQVWRSSTSMTQIVLAIQRFAEHL